MYLLLIANVYFTPFYSDTFVIQNPICLAAGVMLRWGGRNNTRPHRWGRVGEVRVLSPVTWRGGGR